MFRNYPTVDIINDLSDLLDQIEVAGHKANNSFVTEPARKASILSEQLHRRFRPNEDLSTLDDALSERENTSHYPRTPIEQV